MSNYSIKIPDIGEGITEVELVEWFVNEGDRVHEDQQVASVMTEKVSVDITSPVSGTVATLGGKAGDVLAVGADLILIRLETGGSDNVAASQSKPESQSSSASQSQTRATESATEKSEVSQRITDSTPAGKKTVATKAATDPESVKTDQAPTAKPDSTPVSTAPVAALASTPHQRLLQKVQASPAVRKRAADLSIDLNQLANQLGKTHLHHADLDQHLQGGSSTVRSAGGVQSIPVIGVRRQIAKKMQESAQTIPHFSYVEAIDVTEVEQWRKQLNAQWAESRGRLTLLPFLVRALCLALTWHPAINSRYNAEQNVLEQYEDVHVAIATQTDQGLMVPVLENAQQLSLWRMADQIRELAEHARQGTGSLTAKSTITLSSLGAMGGIVATPIINAPEVAIIGVNRQVQQPVVIEGEIQIRTMMNLSSSFDHRFVDGLHAAEFIQDVRRILESPQLYFMT